MSDSPTTRELVLDILLLVTRDHVFSSAAIHSVLDKYRYLSKQERAFVTRVSEGTIERMIEMDYILNQFSRTPVNKMKPVIRCILRSGVYQLKYMDAVPAHAACSEAVNLAVRRGFRGLKGFVNGVMRNIARNMQQITWPNPEKDPVGALSVRYSMPEWLTKRFIRQYGPDRTEGILQAFLADRPTAVRAETARISAEELKQRLSSRGIRVTETDGPAYAFAISGYDMLERIPEFQQGLFYVQDISSMEVAELGSPKPGDHVIDVCAAPGGKSLHCFSLMHGEGTVEARDLSPQKTERIQENFQRIWPENKNLTVKVWDASVPDPSAVGTADLVIADLPCSGLGVIGIKPDIKYHASEEGIRSLAELQRRILDTVWQYAKPGGTVIYSTCTMTPEENEQTVAAFLAGHPEMRLETERQILPEQGRSGFYLAKLVRNHG
ncbi:MAG: 16S rRNA (cytosine(967)-C(5))-methyltransferase RsmB [Eubacterium sp.]|jgi:16S rRNA (cytosine967-C5)-methyltransferase